MARTTIKVFGIDVLELNLPKRNKTHVDHKILKEQIEINNFPRCKYMSSTNIPSRYDEQFTLEVINHYTKRTSYYVDVRFIDGINKGKIITGIRFNDLTKGNFKIDLANILNETENEVVHEKVQDEKKHKGLIERIATLEFLKSKAEKERDEEKRKRIEESEQHAEQIHLQFQRTRAEYNKRTEVEKERDTYYALTVSLNAELEQTKYERDVAQEFASDENLETIVMFAQMGMGVDEIKQAMKRFFN